MDHYSCEMSFPAMKEKLMKMDRYICEMPFPTMKEFEQKVYEKAGNAIPWKNVEVFEIYRIDEVMEVKTSKFGDAAILRIVKRDQSRVNVWAPGLLKKSLLGKTLPCFIMPMGIRKFKNDDQRTYHAFELLSAEEFEEPQMEVRNVSNDLLSTAEELVIKKYFVE